MVVADPSVSQKQPHPPRFYKRYLDAVRQAALRFWKWLNTRTNGFVAYLAQALQNFSSRGVTEATVFGYWSTFSLFPLVMLATVVATLIFGAEHARNVVNSALNQFVPASGSSLISDNIDKILTNRAPFGILGIVGLIYGSAGLFTNLQWGLSRIFRDKQQRQLPMQILVGVIMMVILGVLTAATLFASALFNNVGTSLVGQQAPFLLSLGAALIPLSLDILIFFMMYRLVPHRKISWKSILPASILGGVIWELGKNVFGWYVVNVANFGAVYGSLGTVIGLLTWTYLTGCLVSICGEIAVATDDWRSKRPRSVAIDVPDTNKPATHLPSEVDKHEDTNLPIKTEGKPA